MIIVECEKCNGTGEVEIPVGMYTGDPRRDNYVIDECPVCFGSGEIEEEEEE